MTPLVTIIVPIYKVEEYLHRCIYTAINQTYKNIEIILVDDGSPDNCPQICDYYAEKDNRIVVIHKENGGLSDARNKAIDIANGEFLFFLDSDDMIALNAIEILINIAVKEKSEMIVSSKYTSFSKEIESNTVDVDNYYTVKSEKALEIMFCDNMRWEAWGTLYKRELFDFLRYPTGRIYEDIPVTSKAVMMSKSVSFVDSRIYYYFIRRDGIMRNNNSLIKIDLFESVNDTVNNFNSLIDKKTKANAISGICQELASRVHIAYNDRESNKLFINKSRDLLKKNMYNILFANKISIKQKIFIVAVTMNISKLIWRK